MNDQRWKTRKDGSIDTGHYVARGRHMRSEAAHGFLAGVGGILRMAARVAVRRARGDGMVPPVRTGGFGTPAE